MKIKRLIPFDFVLERLAPLDPITKPMFGCEAIYARGKIVLILREKDDYRSDNGVWLATTVEHHASLRAIFPNLRSLQLFGSHDGPTGWQVLPVDADDFESSVERACQLVLADDPRIGKIPKPRRSKARGTLKKKSVVRKRR